MLGILLLAGLGDVVGCVASGQERVPEGVTYATTGSNTNTNANPNTEPMGTGGNPNGGTGGSPNGGTGGNSNGGTGGNPNTADPNAGTPIGPPPAGPVPGLTLTARLNASRCVDILGGETAPGSAIDLYDCNASEKSQLWQFVRGQLRATGNRCLDLATAPAVGTPLVINPCDDALPSHQQWTLEEGSIKNNATAPGFCVALHFGSLDNGTVLELATCASGNDSQHWSANRTGTSAQGLFVVSAVSPDRCLVASADGAVTWDVCTDPSAGGWTVEGTSQGTTVANGGKCMTGQGTALALVPCNGDAAQLFSLAQGALRSPDGTQCVGAKPDAANTAVPVQLAPCDQGDMGQQWSLGGR